ncbi:unnamed protein product [Adineta steineri]|uniref:Uncharacterized protein n=1 Tax=Adineta steineri TaxID=433720 RepID=A0A820DKR3_9BILA|nr:unnamed protein product [Adineta steineri]CAF4233971.1 unnamed protein product [Adineta steineri]
MDTCQFTYVSLRDGIQRTALGVEQAWEVLCAKLHRDGPGLPNGKHYFTISVDGPQLFAVDTESDSVYYHECGVWCCYVTARDIIIGTIPDDGTGCPPRATADSQQ